MSDMFKVVLCMWILLAGGLSFVAIDAWLSAGVNANKKQLRSEAGYFSLVFVIGLAILGIIAFAPSGCRAKPDCINRDVLYERVPIYE